MRKTDFRWGAAGFTLLELLVVLTIVGMLLGLVVPRLAGLRNAQSVRAAMGDLGTAFVLARQSALARRSTVALVFDTAAAVVHIRSADGPIRRSDLGASFGVSLSANRDSAVYDARGLGYGVTNLSVAVRRGNFVDTLRMSRLGRARW
jgi:prepilin-type N-terminal cleavage/methylation domain-containing protein